MEFGINYHIRELKKEDKLKSFKTGHEDFQPLKTFLINDALSYHCKNIAKTYVAIKLEEGRDVSVIGFITMICSEIDISSGNVPIEDFPKIADRYTSLPAIKIARLAVDSRYRKNKIGISLIAIAFALATDQIAPHVGCRYVVTDAKKAAVSFYEKSGFLMLDTQENRNSDTPVMFLDINSLTI